MPHVSDTADEGKIFVQTPIRQHVEMGGRQFVLRSLKESVQVSFGPSLGLSRLTTPFSLQTDATVTASCVLNHRRRLMTVISSKKTS